MWKVYNKDNQSWDKLILHEENFPYRQLSKWSDYKRSHKWKSLKLQFYQNNKLTNYANILYKEFSKLIFIYIPGGLYRRKNINELINFIKKIKCKRFYYIRIDDNRNDETDVDSYDKLNFTKSKYLNNKFRYSLRVNLNGDIKSKLSEIDSKWRYNFRRSLKNGIEIKTKVNPNLKSLLNLANEMEKNKNISQIHSLSEVTNMLKYFKDNLVVKTAYKNNELIGFRMAFFFKQIAWDIYGVTSIKGRNNKAGYQLIWSIIEDCYKRNIAIYDLGAIYDQNMRHFKTGIADYEFRFPGEYEKSNLPILKNIISMILKVRGTQFLNK